MLAVHGKHSYSRLGIIISYNKYPDVDFYTKESFKKLIELRESKSWVYVPVACSICISAPNEQFHVN